MLTGTAEKCRKSVASIRSLFSSVVLFWGHCCGHVVNNTDSGRPSPSHLQMFLNYNPFFHTGLAYTSPRTSGFKNLALDIPLQADHIFWMWQKELMLKDGSRKQRPVSYVWSLRMDDSFFQGFKDNHVYGEQSTPIRSLIRNVIFLILLFWCLVICPEF